MKNSQKGFVAPLLIVVIALLVIGGGVYVYKNKKTEAPAVVDAGTQQNTNQNQQQTNTQKLPLVNSSEPCTRDGSMGTYRCKSPVLKVNGPQELNSNQLGTWTVDAYSPNDKGEGSTLTYSVKWGDSAVVPKFGTEYPPFTHAYSQFGLHSLAFTAKDSTGAQVTASTSVRVMNTTSPGLNTTTSNSRPNNAVSSSSSLAQNTVPPIKSTVVGTSQIVNGIDYMKEGSLGDFLISQSNGYNLNTTNILNNFYSNHNDDYDFIAVLSPKPMQSDWSLMMNQSGETIGFDFASVSSPSKKIKSLVQVDISGPDSVAKSGVSVADFEQGNMHTTLTSYAHEIAHHWLAYIPWEGMKSAHYTNMVDLFSGNLSYSDPMEYNRWVNTATGKVCVDNNAKTVTQKFSNLSLYLMGLIAKSSVQPIPVIQTGADYSYGQPECGQTTNFTGSKTYTIDDIITLAGKDRTPSFPNTQRDFKIGYVVVVPANENTSSNTMTFANDIVSQFPQYWSDVTSGLSNIIR